MKTFILCILSTLILIAPVSAADLGTPPILGTERSRALDKLPEPLIQAAYQYLAHGKVLDKTFKTCEQFPYFMDTISQGIEVDESVWQTLQFKQQVVGGFSPEQIAELEIEADRYVKQLADIDVRSPVPLTNKRAWCDYKGTVLFNISIRKIYDPNYQNYVVKKDAWVQATQDLSLLVLD